MFALLFVVQIRAQPGDCTVINNFWATASRLPATWSATNCCVVGTVAQREGLSITCVDGRITEFVATGQTLVGVLPSFVALTALVTLDLSDNTFTGPIPALPASLTTLNLRNSGVSGALPAGAAIPFDVCDVSLNAALCRPTVASIIPATCVGVAQLLPCPVTTTARTVATTPRTTTGIATLTVNAVDPVTSASALPSSTPLANSAGSTDPLNSSTTPIIVGSVIGGIVLVAVVIAGFVFQSARRKVNEKPLTSIATLRRYNNANNGNAAEETINAEASTRNTVLIAMEPVNPVDVADAPKRSDSGRNELPQLPPSQRHDFGKTDLPPIPSSKLDLI
ncbi:hypothetical protein HK098_003568 [Nowakowskiella sp. JEL0407]|nr:hypothetical protein HK098_003568 [Nowakowskiella sp. JEL0407]